MFIVFEGCDGTGKSTQAQLLHDSIEGSVLYAFPVRHKTRVGQLLDDYLKGETTLTLDCAIVLFLTNMWSFKEEIEQHLNEGKTVIVDRYIYSTIAYGRAQGAELDALIEGYEKKLPKPDIVLYLERENITYGDSPELYETPKLQEEIRKCYMTLIEKSTKKSAWKKISPSNSIEKVFADVCRSIKKIN